MTSVNDDIGIVAIGRNEGDRLKRCLTSLAKFSGAVVYADSGSTDDSVAYARSAGVHVVELDKAKPFSAARARNEGFAALTALNTDPKFIMFIDGDCELVDGFVDAAVAKFGEDETIAIVTGRCRERFPDATIYNRLCDMEWNGPVGDIDACGGIFLIRSPVMKRIGGFNDTLIAGEEPELCSRVREREGRIVRIAHDMCFHDADMRRFSQWWRRAIRAGNSYAQVNELHPGAYAAERRRAWLWGLFIPGAALLSAPFNGGLSLLLLALYGVSFCKTSFDLVRNGAQLDHALVHAAFLTISKFPNLIGMLSFKRKRASGKPIHIIEYK